MAWSRELEGGMLALHYLNISTVLAQRRGNMPGSLVGQFIVQSGAAHTISRLEQAWQEVKDLHAEIHHETADDVAMGQWRQELFARSLQGIATPCKVALLQ